MSATTAHCAKEQRLVELTEIRIALDADLAERRREIAKRRRLRDHVQAEIDQTVAEIARAHRAARGLRCSLGELVAGLNPTQEGNT